MLRKTPGFTVVACLTLILGIGATTAIFSVVNAVLLRPLPYKQSEKLVHVIADEPGDSRSGVSYQSFEFWRANNRAFIDLAACYRNTGFSRVTVGGASQPESAQAAFASATFFDVMGISPAIGRVFHDAEEQSRETLAVLSDTLWKRRFAGDPAAIGRTLDIDGRAFTIIGVMPPEFQFPSRETQLWLPITTHRLWNDRPQPDGVHTRGYYMRWNVVGRLRPALTPSAAFEDIRRLNSQLSSENPDWNMGLGVKVIPLTIEISGNARLALFVLLASVCLVLLIACGNVANLMLARGVSRIRELSVRAALGATQGRIIRQVLTESVMLVLLSATGAVILASAAVRVLIRYGPADLPRLDEASIDGRVLCFTLAVSILTAVLFGIMPALSAGHSDPSEYLKSGGRTTTTGRAHIRIGSGLIIAEFALAVLLLSASGLLIRSLHAVESAPRGFHTDNVLTMRIRLPDTETATRKAEFANELITRLRSLPGVAHAGGIGRLFDLGGPPANSLRSVEGHPPEQETSRPLTWTNISGDYFQAMGISLLAGRYFSDRDTANSPLVAIIDDTMARRYWPNENRIGRRFKGQDARGKNDDWLTIIGVVGSVRRHGLEREPTPHVYEWHKQAGPINDWLIRTQREPQSLTNAIRAAVREVEPHAVVSKVMTMRQQIESQTAARRFQTWLLSLFAALALLLSMVGIYGVISYATAQRTHEIGIRMALGAKRQSILGMVLRQGARLALYGLALGTAAALAITQVLAGLLYGVTPADPLTSGIVAAVLLGVAAAATLAPALRATQVNPLTALRAE